MIKEYTISELTHIILGGTPKTSINEYWDGNIKWVTAKDVSNCYGRYIYNTEKYISQQGVENSAAKIMGKDTIIITSRGTVGKVVLLSEDMSFNQTCYGLLSKSSLLRQKFLYYYLKTISEIINSYSYGSVFDTITKKTFDHLKIKIPTLDVQDFIISMLSSLDDKIELNSQMNTTLEAIGQALFKHWFIDFEFPDENGQPYRSSGGEMVDSELGEIPAGWRVGTLADICDIIMGQSPPGKTYNENGEGTPFYQGITDFGFRFPSRRVYCTEPKRFAEKNDVLLSVRAPVGSLNVANEKCAIGRGLSALRLKNNHGSYLYYLLMATKGKWNIYDSEGTVFGSINKSNISNFEVIVPPDNLVIDFNNLVLSKDEQIFNNIVQNNCLSQIRDSLLPKLMSGQIRVGQ